MPSDVICNGAQQTCQTSLLASPFCKEPAASITDVNFNSPDHQIPQDGSYIQDEDVRLLLEFGTCEPPLNFMSTSWLGRNAKQAIDFDANFAELDFDNFTTKDILAFGEGKLGRFANSCDASELISPNYPQQRFIQLGLKRDNRFCKPVIGIGCNELNNNVIDHQNAMRSSIDLSLSRSFYSSCGGDESIFANVGEVFGITTKDADNMVPNSLTQSFILQKDANFVEALATTASMSNSLGFSDYVQQTELLRKVCMTNKRDYMLTFDNKFCNENDEDSDYLDAELSDASDRSLSQEVVNWQPVSSSSADESQNFTTWGRIKRSYEEGRPTTELYSSKCTSLPNLQNSLYGFNTVSFYVGDGAPDRLVSNTNSQDSASGIKTMPIYDIMSSSSAMRLRNQTDGVSLLKAFQSKLSADFACFPQNLKTSVDSDATRDKLISLLITTNSSTASSGYATGEQAHGSENYCTTDKTGNANSNEINNVSQRVATSKSSNWISHSKADAESANALAEPSHVEKSDVVRRNEDPNLSANQQPVEEQDWRYEESLVDGHYIDVNHNEIGFVPPSTAPYQVVRSSEQLLAPQEFAPDAKADTSSRSDSGEAIVCLPPAKPPRTFIDSISAPCDDNETSLVIPAVPFTNADSQLGIRATSPQHNRERSATSVSVATLRDSSTQVPTYVVDRSVQTCELDDGKLVTVVTTSIRDSISSKPLYVSRTMALTQPSQSPDYYRMFGGTYNNSSIDKPRAVLNHKETSGRYRCTAPEERPLDLPNLDFMKLPAFDIPPLFPHVARFPFSFCPAEEPSYVRKSQSLLSAPQPSEALLKGESSSSSDTLQAMALMSSSQKRRTSPLQWMNRSPTFLPEPPEDPRLILPPRTINAHGRNSLVSREKVSPRAKPPAKDSGFGSTGPQHIDDWESLQMLLPKEVIDTYSFFHANAKLLGTTTTTDCKKANPSHSNQRQLPSAEPSLSGSFNIDKPMIPTNSAQPLKPFTKIKSCSTRKQSSVHNVSDETSVDPYCKEPHATTTYQRNSCCCDSGYSLQRGKFHGSDKVGDGFHLTNQKVHPILQKNLERAACNSSKNSHPVSQGETGDFASSACQKQSRPVCMRRSDLHREEVFSVNSSVMSTDSISDDVYTFSDDEENVCKHAMEPSELVVQSEYTLRLHEVGADAKRFFSLPTFSDYSDDNSTEYSSRKSLVNQQQQQNSMQACATCFRVRSPSLDLPAASVDNGEFFCDCQTSDVMDARRDSFTAHLSTEGNIAAPMHLKGHDHGRMSRSCYEQKRELVLAVKLACEQLLSLPVQTDRRLTVNNASDASIFRVIKFSLCPAIEKVIVDGLRENCSLWDVVLTSATMGPATKCVHQLVKQMSLLVGQPREHSLCFTFVVGLLHLRSLDCWFSYLVLKDNILKANYTDKAFLMHAAGFYKELFDQLVASLQPLSLLAFDRINLLTNVSPCSAKITFRPLLDFTFSTPTTNYHSADALATAAAAHSVRPRQEFHESDKSAINSDESIHYDFVPTRLPSDSRVPKSSSMPSRLHEFLDNRQQPRSSQWQSQFAAKPIRAYESLQKAKSLSFNGALFHASLGQKLTESEYASLKSDPPSINLFVSTGRTHAYNDSSAEQDESMEWEGQEDAGSSFSEDEEGDHSTYEGAARINCKTNSASFDCFENASRKQTEEQRYVCAVDEHCATRYGELSFRKGETMRVVSIIDENYFRCQRDNDFGICPRKKLTYITFL